jgi:nitric oxide reductase subunit B
LAGLFRDARQQWRIEGEGGLDPQELRELTAFFAWTAWASTAARPGLAHSYTNNFPYDRLVGNVLTGGAVIYSVLSLVFLLAGHRHSAAGLWPVRLSRMA